MADLLERLKAALADRYTTPGAGPGGAVGTKKSIPGLIEACSPNRRFGDLRRPR